MQVHPEDAEDFIELLTQVGLYTEAVKKYIEILNNPRFNSKQSKGHYELWSEMVDLLVEHANEVETGHETGIDVERLQLLDIVSTGLLTGRDEKKRIRAELYKLNVYGELWAAIIDPPRADNWRN